MSDHRRHVVYPAIGAVLLVVAALLAVGEGQTATGQASASSTGPAPSAVQWRLVLDGERVAWPDTVSTASLDRVRAVGRRVLAHLRRKGYYYARLDSVRIDTGRGTATARLYVHRGPQVRIRRLRIAGDSAVPETELRALMRTEEGDRLHPGRLEEDIQALLDRYETAGHPLAQIR
ncbi:MAG: POTRA domain-containing protein, partial [Salinibacter sp.]